MDFSRSTARSAVGVLALGAALSIGSPAATAAEDPLTRLVLDDATGDVWRSPVGTTQVDDVPGADVVSASVLHGRRNVEVTASFDDLHQTDRQTYAVQLTTPGDRWWSLNVTARPGNWDGTLRAWSGGDGREGSEHRIRCPGAAHRIDYEADTVHLLVPRSCVARPEWIRASIVNWLDQGAPEGESQTFWDHPHDTGSEGGTTRRLFRAPAPDSTEPAAPYRVELTDPTGDVWTYDDDFLPAPEMTSGDVERTTINHRAHRLTVRLQLADLQPGGRQSWRSWILSRSDEHFVLVRVSPRHPEGVVRLLGGSEGRLDCDRLTHRVDFDSDEVLVRIPRGCLGRPSWVRLHLGSFFVPGSDPETEVHFYVDDPHSDQAFSEELTPRIHAATGP